MRFRFGFGSRLPGFTGTAFDPTQGSTALGPGPQAQPMSGWLGSGSILDSLYPMPTADQELGQQTRQKPLSFFDALGLTSSAGPLGPSPAGFKPAMRGGLGFRTLLGGG